MVSMRVMTLIDIAILPDAFLKANAMLNGMINIQWAAMIYTSLSPSPSPKCRNISKAPQLITIQKKREWRL